VQHVGGASGLPGVRAKRFVQFGFEHCIGAKQCFNAHCGDDINRVENERNVFDGKQQHAKHAVGAINEREAFFFLQLDWFYSRFGKQFVHGAHVAASVNCFALAHQHKCAVR
jgi:hypothetical protein